MLHIEYFKHLSALIDNPVFFAFFLIVLADIITGFLKSLIVKNTTSSKGLNGLIKHSTLLLIMAILYPYLEIYGMADMANTLIIFYILFYAISLVENLGEMGIPIPEWLRKYIYKLSDEYKKGDVKDEKLQK